MCKRRGIIPLPKINIAFPIFLKKDRVAQTKNLCYMPIEEYSNGIGISCSMRSNFLHWCRTSSYLLGAVFFLWLGYRVEKYLVILEDNLDNNVLLVLRESPYLSLSFPLWCANLIAGVVLFCTLLLVVPVIGVLRQRLFHFATFSILLLICVLPLHVHFDTARFNFEKLFFHSYHLILGVLA